VPVRRTPSRNDHGPATCTAGHKAATTGGTGVVDLDDAKAEFKAAWVRIRAGVTDEEIAAAHRIAQASAEALARYDARR
jgi:hypothetical protein